MHRAGRGLGLFRQRPGRPRPRRAGCSSPTPPPARAAPRWWGRGRIGDIIGAKPTQRRALLEEAAGITGLHARRHEAELKLRAAETNLERLQDVIGTLETQLRDLERQARHAKRYKRLSERIRETEAALLLLRWMAARTRV